MKNRYLVLFFGLSFFFISACGGRVVKSEAASKKTASFLKKYAKEYPLSPFGQSAVAKVEVNSIEQVALNWSQADVFVELKNNQIARVLIDFKRRPPLGWKVDSWEVVDIR